ncbi:hypothetical protein Bca101_021028 [Brassica carinata]
MAMFTDWGKGKSTVSTSFSSKPDSVEKHPIDRYHEEGDDAEEREIVDDLGGSLRSVFTFSTVEEFWRQYHHIPFKMEEQERIKAIHDIALVHLVLTQHLSCSLEEDAEAETTILSWYSMQKSRLKQCSCTGKL